MSELSAILRAFKQTDFATRQAVLATVVKVTGSSYRSPGARMYITDDGRWTGSISGGCLEGDALRKARQVMHSHSPMLVTYDTMDDDGKTLGVALGCNGIIDVLLQSVSLQESPFLLLQQLEQPTEPTALATVYQSNDPSFPVGSQWLFNDLVSKMAIPVFIAEKLQETLRTRQSLSRTIHTENGWIELFFEVFDPPLRLIIYGGGFDARPVASFAQQLGWQVSVADECVAHLIPNFFPSAQLISCHRDKLVSEVEITPYTAAVLMSHNLHYDMAALKSLLPTQAAYIGILGPRKRTEKMLSMLLEEGITLSESDHERLHSPIGLDIGAGSPEEIALSILAEIKAVFAGRRGGFLKERKGPIHLKTEGLGEVLKEVHAIRHDTQATEKY